MKRPTHLSLPGHDKIALPMVWLGQSVRTTVVTRRYPEFATESWMVSLGDAVHRPRLVETVFKADIRDRIAVKGPLMLDSGGFTMMMNNRSLKVREIADIYRETQAELCVTLDIPPLGADTSRKRMAKYRRTLENLESLNADAALPILEERNDIQAVVTDIKMPGTLCGLRLAQAIKKRWPPVQLIIVSGLSAPTETEFPGVGRFIPKPYGPRELLRALYELLGPSPAPYRYCSNIVQNYGKVAQ